MLADLPWLRAAVVPPEGESLRDRVRELLHSGGRRREAGGDAISPPHLVVSPAHIERVKRRVSSFCIYSDDLYLT